MVTAALLGVLVAVAGLPLGWYGGLACAALQTGCPATAPPAGSLPRVTRLTAVQAALSGSYAGLGDSYSSGEGVYAPAGQDGEDGGGTGGKPDPGRLPAGEGAAPCHRARGSYVPLVAGAHRFGGGAGFWACSGATTGQLLRGQHGQRPQVARVDRSTSLVTVTIGGNDAGFARVLTACIVKLPWSSACVDQDAEVARRVDGLRSSLHGVLRELRSRAPQARIVVLGYPRPFPARPADRVDNLGVEDQLWLNRVTRRLNDVMREVATGFDRAVAAFGGPGSVEFVDAYDAFDGHEAGTAQPYLNRLIVHVKELSVDSRSFHPTGAGYRRLAELVDRQIVTGPGRPLNNVVLSRP
ncbi:SGNH/GDSL hydrolase family protein [Nonomuraea rhodomycinica]|uniref:SGNH/GDSL hydrolase family protein n=1 Tax=Nonomuraea rhodomycinica TaxID=1712872 RepID=A0A7Y6IKI4_9ACTN|nr:SGNH/GDSL hydrolase family protein [Nonomuraea rhodomycinica]NUW39852.1 SGNH/GDSL hydrolase family protein [Nonomuraea rhodomycinica]